MAMHYRSFVFLSNRLGPRFITAIWLHLKFRNSYIAFEISPTDGHLKARYGHTMQIYNESDTTRTVDSTMNEAGRLLDEANHCAISALEKLALIQGDAFEAKAVRELYPLFKVYSLFSNLEEFERDMIIHLYQAKTCLGYLRRHESTDIPSCELTETETRFFTLRDRINAAGIPERLSVVQRVILETEFFHAHGHAFGTN